MTAGIKLIKKFLSRLCLKFSQHFANDSGNYSIMAQQNYQIYRMRDI